MTDLTKSTKSKMTLCDWCDHPEKHNQDEPPHDPEICECDCHKIQEFTN